MKKTIITFLVGASSLALVAFAQESVPTQPVEQVQPIQQVQPADGGNIQPLPPQPGEPQKPMPPDNGQFFPPEDNGEDNRDMVEPREIQDALRQIKDLKKEIGRVLKAAKKLVGFEAEVSQLNDLLNRITSFEERLRSGNVDHETMRDYWDSQPWDEFNVIRLKIELPKEVARMEKDMKRLDKSLTKTKYVLEGIDMNVVRGAADSARTIIAQVKSALASGSYEDAQEAMQNFWDGEVAHPGEIIGIVDRTQNIARQLRSVKAVAVKQEIMDLLTPIISAANNGDFREANMMFNEIDRFIFKMIDQLKRKSSVDTQMKAKMEQLEQKMMQKLQEEEQRKTNNQEPQSGLMPYKSYRSASLLDNVLFSVSDFFGF